MKRFCRWHSAHVPEEQAVLVAAAARTSGPDVPVYACVDCADRLGLIPLEQHPVGSTGAPRFIGRPDSPPILPGGRSTS